MLPYICSRSLFLKRDEKEIIEIVRTDNKDSAVPQFCFGIRRYRGRARE